MKTNYIRKFLIFTLCWVFTFFLPLISAAAERIQPETDLEYLGAFKMPSIDGYAWSGFGMTFNPKGNSGAGSLFIIQGDANTSARYNTAEISIPQPTISKNSQSLNSAIELQSFKDIALINSTSNIDKFGDVCFLEKQGSQSTDKLYWVAYQWYNVANNDYRSVGWAELTLSNPISKGTWHVGSSSEDLTNKTGKYIFSADKSWADANVQGRYLLTGRLRGGGNASSQGPTLYAIAPWTQGNPPPDGSNLNMTRLLQYNDNWPYEPTTFPNYSPCDEWNDGVWISAGSKQAVIFSGNKGTNSNFCYGGDECGDPCNNWKGNHCYPYSPMIIFYDVDQLASVARGSTKPENVTPYSMWKPKSAWSNDGCSSGFGGAAYDSTNQKLFIIELHADDRGTGAFPVVHIYKVLSSGISPTNPQPPTGLRIAE